MSSRVISTTHHHKSGFSLVELSIVLVILGLLTGGILTGQSLIRAAELRSVTTEFQSYQTAVQTFRSKYFALPGDMNNATDFWDAMTNCGAASTSGSGTETCNGDADGTLDNAGGSGQNGETLGFWQHLANAGLVEGRYTGIAGTGGADHYLTNQNIPGSKLGNAGWGAQTRNTTSGSDFYDGNWGNTLQFGNQDAAGTNFLGAITPEEAWNIDTKIDDGRPGTGKIIAIHWDDCGGASASDDYDTGYALATTSQECALMFVNPF